jgi:D-threonate/D-erythronate kinase
LRRWILAIADDLTGALETGSKFARYGLASCVTTETSVANAPEAPVLVIDTETRHLPAKEAEAVVQRTAASARRFEPWLVYKKTDSTLRGNIAAEFRALLSVFPQRSLIYAPAYPEMGRTVRGGRLFVNDMPVHQSGFARDSLNPVRESDISRFLGEVPAQILDGESNADVAAAAQQIMAHGLPTLAAGPAALAEALAAFIQPQERTPPEWPRLPRCLIVNGSMHPASASQIAFAWTHGCVDNGWTLLDHDTGGSGLDRASRMGDYVRRVIESTPVDGLIVFGGDTAFGIHSALGAPMFHSFGDVVPGVPVSRCGDLIWVTKAGGFGAAGILCEIRRLLT